MMRQSDDSCNGDEGAPIPPAAWRVLHLPLRFGGLDLRSAAEAAQAAWWAFWFDSLILPARRSGRRGAPRARL